MLRYRSSSVNGTNKKAAAKRNPITLGALRCRRLHPGTCSGPAAYIAFVLRFGIMNERGD
jgi:hypothetical protein